MSSRSSAHRRIPVGPFWYRAVLMLLSMVITGAGVSLAQPGREAQKQERRIKKTTWRDEPIKIEKVRVRGFPVLDEKVNTDDDWLKALTVSVRNTSGRIIKYIEIDLVFPRPQDSSSEPVSSDHLIYGQYPLPPGQIAPANSQLPLLPDETVDLTVTDYDGMMEFLKHTNYRASIKDLELEISAVIFDDDTKWSGGRLYRRNPNNPDGWILLPRAITSRVTLPGLPIRRGAQ